MKFLFQLEINEIVYLVDDSNRAVMPEEDGSFGFKLTPGAHYKVNGTPRNMQQPAPTAPPPTPVPAQARSSTPTGFSTPASLQNQHSFAANG